MERLPRNKQSLLLVEVVVEVVVLWWLLCQLPGIYRVGAGTG